MQSKSNCAAMAQAHATHNKNCKHDNPIGTCTAWCWHVLPHHKANQVTVLQRFKPMQLSKQQNKRLCCNGSNQCNIPLTPRRCDNPVGHTLLHLARQSKLLCCNGSNPCNTSHNCRCNNPAGHTLLHSRKTKQGTVLPWLKATQRITNSRCNNPVGYTLLHILKTK